MRKSMSVITAMLLSLCIIIAPITSVAAVEDTPPDNSGEGVSASSENEISVQGTNGFGNLLSDEIAGKQAEQQENMGKNIFSNNRLGQYIL